MGLLSLKTDLKSLKYGSDRPNSGDSREPFIKKEIPENPAGASPDFLLRQGALNRGIEDGARIGKFLTTTKGLAFTTNMNLLAAQNPKIVGNPKNLYNPLNTILQTGVNATGAHLNLLGLDPTDNSNKYNDIYKVKYNEEKTNKLLILTTSKIGSPSSTPNTPTPSSLFAGDIGNLAEAVGIFGNQAFNEGFIASIPDIPIPLNADHGVNITNNNLLQSYTGGPGAGITGLKTNVRRTEFTVGSKGYTGKPTEEVLGRSLNKIAEAKTYFNQNSPSGSISEVTYGAGSNNSLVFESSITSSLEQSKIKVAEAKTYFNQNSPSGSISEVTHGTVADNKVITLKNAYKKGTRASSIPYYDPNPKYVTSSYTAGSNIESDKFNKENTRKLNIGFGDPSQDQLFKFFLNPITPDLPLSTYLYWQAYVESFSDNVSAEYDSYTYVGRGYPSYKYKGFTKEISLEFTIVSHSPNQMESIYRKLNELQALLAPSYSYSGYLRGNFFKLTFGDYLINTPGILKGFSLSPIFEAGFDVGTGEEGRTSGLQLPKAIKVSGFNFTPIADNNNQVFNYGSQFINNYSNI